MVQNMNGLSSDFLIPPGETLNEILTDRNIKQKEFAIRTGLSEKHISHIINGLATITYETAMKFEQVLEIPASFWNSLEANYQEETIILQNLKNIKPEELLILKEIPYKDLVEWNYLENKTSKEEKTIQLRRFFNVSNLLKLNELAVSNIAFRKSQKINFNLYAMFAWLKICEMEANIASKNNLDLEKLTISLPEIKKLILISNINDSIKAMTKILDECGVTFKVVHNIKGAPVQGMISKVNNNAILYLTIRNKYADIFWFTFAHELGHLLNDNLSKKFVDFEMNSREDNEEEKRADNFANEFLLNSKSFDEFVCKKEFTKTSITEFAHQHETTPGIVVGRLQHHNYIQRSWNNDLRIKYEWNKN